MRCRGSRSRLEDGLTTHAFGLPIGRAEHSGLALGGFSLVLRTSGGSIAAHASSSLGHGSRAGRRVAESSGPSDLRWSKVLEGGLIQELLLSRPASTRQCRRLRVGPHLVITMTSVKRDDVNHPWG